MKDSQDTTAPGAAGPESELGSSSRQRTSGRRRRWGLTASIVGALAAVPVVAFTINGSASAATGDTFDVSGYGPTPADARSGAVGKADQACGAGNWTSQSEVVRLVPGEYDDQYLDVLSGVCN